MYFKNIKPPSYYGTGNRYLCILHTRLRNACSALNGDLFHANLVPSSYCGCGYPNENSEHFFLFCNRYDAGRDVLFHKLSHLNIPINIELILNGNPLFSYDTNSYIFKCVQQYIKDSARFAGY